MNDSADLARAEAHEGKSNPQEKEYSAVCKRCGDMDFDGHECDHIRCATCGEDIEPKAGFTIDSQAGYAVCPKCKGEMCSIKDADEVLK